VEVVAMTYELWRLIARKNEATSTWELIGRFPNAKRARLRIHELAGTNIVSPDEETYWYQDAAGTHTFRLEASPTPMPADP
jgi:hypothetical protein